MHKQKLVKKYNTEVVPIIEEINGLKNKYDTLQCQLEELALAYNKQDNQEGKEEIEAKALEVKKSLREIEKEIKEKEKEKLQKKDELKALQKENTAISIKTQLLTRVEKIIDKESKDREENVLCNIPDSFTYEQIDQLAQYLEAYAEGSLAYKNFKMDIPQSCLEMLSQANYRDFMGLLGSEINKPANEISLTGKGEKSLEDYIDDYEEALAELCNLLSTNDNNLSPDENGLLPNVNDLLKTFYSKNAEAFQAGTKEHMRLIELYTKCADNKMAPTLESLLECEEELKADQNRKPAFLGLICQNRITKNENKIRYLSQNPMYNWFESWIQNIADKLGIVEFQDMINKAEDKEFDKLDIDLILELATKKKERIKEFKDLYSAGLKLERDRASSISNAAERDIYRMLNLSNLTQGQRVYTNYRIPVIEGGITEILKRIANAVPIPDFSKEAQQEFKNEVVKNISVDHDKIRAMIDYNYLNKDNPELAAVQDFIDNDKPTFTR